MIACLNLTHAQHKNLDVFFVQRTDGYSKAIRILKTNLNLLSSLLDNGQSTFWILSPKIIKSLFFNE